MPRYLSRLLAAEVYVQASSCDNLNCTILFVVPKQFNGNHINEESRREMLRLDTDKNRQRRGRTAVDNDAGKEPPFTTHHLDLSLDHASTPVGMKREAERSTGG